MMNNIDYKLFSTIARMSQKSLLKSMRNFLRKYYPSEKIVATSDYILCEGTIPIMLVAHLDTVFKQQPKEIYYDQRQEVIWSPQGLGADDRAGVFIIMKLIQKGLRPHICFTTEEEAGGIGAKILVSKYQKAPFDVKYIIQLDRQGIKDCVFYTCDNPKFQDFIEDYGFYTEWGTFSDISTICPVWKIAGVNLSVGYFDEHNKIETLHLKGLYLTLRKVQKMLMDAKEAPYFEYIPAIEEEYWRKIYSYYMCPIEDDYNYCFPGYEGDTCICSKCKQPYLKDDCFIVKKKDGSKEPYCIDCVSDNINWCACCGEPFETDNSKLLEDYCQDCKKKLNK